MTIVLSDPDESVEMDPPGPVPPQCGRCGQHLDPYFDESHDWSIGRPTRVFVGWYRHDECDEADALDAMRARTPWLFATPGDSDELDVMGQDWQAGIDVYDLVR